MSDIEDSPSFTPREVVGELDRFVVGQDRAKRAVAVALRNRWRRQRVKDDLRDEIHPKNILMIGPTGVGKTEIARRLARLAGAPFVKVEASRYTEVGYVGRDVETMIRDLTEMGVQMVRARETESVQARAEQRAEERVLDLLLPGGQDKDEATERGSTTREKLRRKLRAGELDERPVSVSVQETDSSMLKVFTPAGMEEMGFNIKDMLSGFMPQRSRQKEVPVREALKVLAADEAQKMLDMEEVTRKAVRLVEQMGIVFIDELDKVAGREGGRGPDVSREGVQRDLLPIVEGTTVNTKHGVVRTDHILFIAAGAFHVAKPSDLIPELQGRFPIRVELDGLTKDDFIRILTEPHNSLIRQYTVLFETEGVEMAFEPEAVNRVAEFAARINERTENIGARRLHTVLERLLDEVSFRAPEMRGQRFVVTAALVEERLADLVEDVDLSRYIL